MAKKNVIPPKKQAQKLAPSGPFHYKGSNFHFAFVCIVIVFSFIIYGNSIPNGYSMDDEFVTHNDSTVEKGITGIPKLFKSRYGWDQKGSYGYRPVVKATFAMEYTLFKGNMHWSHIINLLLYDALCIFLFYFLRKILYDQVGDHFLLIVLALFFTHPLHTEVVDSLKNRDTMLSFLFGFICTYLFVKAFETENLVRQVLMALAACFSYNLGYLAKPDAIVFVAITPLVLFFFNGKGIKPVLISLACLIVASRARVALVNIYLPHTDYQRTFQFFENPLLGTHWYERIQLGFSTLWFYVEKLIFPVNLSVYYGYDDFHPFPPWTDITVILGIALAAGLGWLIYKKRNDRGVWLFSALLFSGTIFVFLNVIRVGPGMVADRFMFLPSVGFALLAALALYTFLKIDVKTNLPKGKATTLYLCAGLVVVLFSARVIKRNPDWKSHFSIYKHDVEVAPRSAKLQSLLADAYLDEIKKDRNLSKEQVDEYYEASYRAFSASIDIYPKYSTSLNNLGMIEYLHNHDLKKASEYFERAIATDSNYTEALFNLGSAKQQLGDNTNAEKYLLMAIKSKPSYDMAYIFLSRVYSSEGKMDKILELNEGALKNGHASDAIYVNIGKVYLVSGDTDKAIDNFNKALGYFNKNIPLCQFMTHYYQTKHDEQKTRYYQALLDSAQAFNNRAMKRE